MYIADAGNSVVRRVTTGGLITTIAGNGTLTPSTGDGGPAAAAQLNPFSVAVDAAGNVYVTDSFNDHVRMLTPRNSESRQHEHRERQRPERDGGDGFGGAVGAEDHRQHGRGRSRSDGDLYGEPGRRGDCPTYRRDYA